MKRFICIIISAVTAFSLCACKKQNRQNARDTAPATDTKALTTAEKIGVPLLTVSCGERSISVSALNCNWTEEAENGLMRNTHADSSHPISLIPHLEKLSLSSFKGQTAVLNFSRQPSSVKIWKCPMDLTGDSPEANREEVILSEGYELDIEENTLYDIFASWNGGDSYGSVGYAFITVRDEN